MTMGQGASLAECVSPNELKPRELEAGADNQQTTQSYHPDYFKEKVWKAKHNWIWHHIDMKAKKTAFCKYFGSKRNTKEYGTYCCLGADKLMAKGVNKGLIIKVLFSSLCVSKVWSQTLQILLLVAALRKLREGKRAYMSPPW